MPPTRRAAATELAIAAQTVPRVRASLLATLSLLLGVTAALTVLTGILAALGIALGVLAAMFAVGGLSATMSRNIAGKLDALLGLALAAGAVVVGLLATTDGLPWLSPDTDQIAGLRDWIESRMPWLFPS